MEVYISQEVLAALVASSITLATGVLWMLYRNLRHVGKFAAALEKGAEVNAALNDELLSVIRDRKEAGEQWAKERIDWNLERVQLQAAVNDIRARANEAGERTDREVNALIRQLAEVRKNRDNMQGELVNMSRRVDNVEAENKNLRQEIAGLKNENNNLKGERAVLIEKVENLTRKLESEIENNHELRCALDKVRERMNGLPSTDDLTKAAEKVSEASATTKTGEQHPHEPEAKSNHVESEE